MNTNKEFSENCEIAGIPLAKKCRHLTSCVSEVITNRTHAEWNAMSKWLIRVVILLLLVMPRAASGQSGEPIPRPEVKSWDFWIGDWTLTGTAKDTPTGPEYSVDWRAHGRWILGGAALEFTTTWKGTGPAQKWLEIMSWDPARRAHTFTGFSSTGEVWSGTTDIGTGGFVEDFLVTGVDGRISKCHNEWTFGVDRLTVSGKSVCKLGNDQWTAFTVTGSKIRTPTGLH